LHGSKEWSGTYLEESASWVSEVLMKEFFEVNGLDPIEPEFLKAHRWRYSIASNPERVGFLWSADQHIGVIGDWLMQSRIEGAYLSGLTFAEHLMEL
jgi:predicted NAD/FAD-dependent oxidoreductase